MSNTENSLMKQTKKELIAIILRKDDTEKKLNKKLADVELDLNKAKSMINENKYTIKDLKEDLDVSNGIISQRNNDVDKLTVVNKDNQASYYPINSDYFCLFIDAMIKFFDTGISPVPKEQTIDVIAVREAGIKAFKSPFNWVEV